jgi:hypothetical protein
MKFYETTYEEYLTALHKNNLHPELTPFFKSLPKNLTNMPNIIFYGASGTGKYTQALNVIRHYSQSVLQGKRITLQTEKYEYSYHISEIHYEIDMALLGCNSKLIWHDVVQQIVDIVAVKPDAHKTAIILCKNFHMIHTELLEIFYSYIQEYNSKFASVHFKFILITEHLCFIPNNILFCSTVVNVCRPTINMDSAAEVVPSQGVPSQGVPSQGVPSQGVPLTVFKPGTKLQLNPNCCVNPSEVLNLKEYNHLNKIHTPEEIPSDIFNTVCDEVLSQLLLITPTTPLCIKAAAFRDAIYNIFVYNLDPVECIWHIISILIKNDYLRGNAISDVMVRSYNFLKYFNNNYRPIYHLEAIFYYILLKIYNIDELDKSV